MTYLYGDSSPSDIEIDYIDFLRRVLEFSVETLQAEERVQTARDRQSEIEQAVQKEIDKLEDLGVGIHGFLDPLGPGDADRPTARCARVIERAVAEAISGEISTVRADLRNDIERIESGIARERKEYIAKLSNLLMTYDLPQAENEIHLALDFGEQYTAQLRSQTRYGVTTTLDLDVPAESPFARQVRLSRFVDILELRAPERVGWIRKQVKMVSHNIAKHYITELTVSSSLLCFKVRATPEHSSPGYNILIDRDTNQVEIACRKSSDGELMQYEIAFEDVAPLIDLSNILAKAAFDLTKKRRTLLDIAFGDLPLVEHEQPAALVDRMIEAMAPVVVTIAERSQSASELVLRRQLDQSHREEIFASKSELARILAPLSESLRNIFDPLDLGPIPEDDIRIDVASLREAGDSDHEILTDEILTGELEVADIEEVEPDDIEPEPSLIVERQPRAESAPMA